VIVILPAHQRVEVILQELQAEEVILIVQLQVVLQVVHEALILQAVAALDRQALPILHPHIQAAVTVQVAQVQVQAVLAAHAVLEVEALVGAEDSYWLIVGQQKKIIYRNQY